MTKSINSNKIAFDTLLAISLLSGLIAMPNTEKALADSPETIALPGTIRDFKGDHPNFGFGDLFGEDWTKVGKHLTEKNGVWVTNESGKNIVTEQLGDDKKPIFNSSSGVGTITNAADFNEWYNDTSGVNLSKPFSLTLSKNADGMYHYSTDAFFPINNELYGNIVDDPALVAPPVLGENPSEWEIKNFDQWENQGYKNRNYFFTYETHSRFVYQGNEVFTFSGDDDVWVYINGKRVIDLSGVHGEETETFVLDTAKASELGLIEGQAYDFDFFFAERNYSGSNFTITTNIELNNAPEANNDTATTSILSSIDIDVLANDTDADGDSKIITEVTPVTEGNNAATDIGNISIAEDGSKLIYDAGAVPGDYTFTYTVEDEHGNSDVGTLVVTVTAFPD